MIGGAALVALLLAGRVVSTIAADVWWAAGISPAAGDAVLGHRLVALAIASAAVLIASAWYSVQMLLVIRSIGLLQVEERVGALVFRQVVSAKRMALWGIAAGVVLGIVAGAGSHRLAGPLLLMRTGIEIGVDDPVAGEDIGSLLTRVPFWEQLLGFATMLVFTGIVLVLLLYLLIGGIRRSHIHADARRHLGGLLAVLALVIAGWYLIEPYRLSLSLVGTPGIAETAAPVVGARAMTGVALAAAFISVSWAVKGRHTALLGGWMVLGLAALFERLVVPVIVPERPVAADHVNDSIAFGVGTGAAPEVGVGGLSVWNEQLLRHAVPGGWRALASGFEIVDTAGFRWLLAASTGDPAPEVIVRTVAPMAREAPPVTEQVWSGRPRILPGATGWIAVGADHPGVDARGFLRRLMLAWAWQAPGMLGGEVVRGDRRLDPVERVAALMPMAEWSLAGIAVNGGRLHWLVQGYAAVDRFPLATRTSWRGREIAGLVPAVIATVEAATGRVAVYRDPAGTRLGDAVADVYGTLVLPAAEMPGWVRRSTGYPAAWLAVQSRVIGLSGSGQPGGELVLTADGTAARQLLIDDAEDGRLSFLLTAYRNGDGMPVLAISDVTAADLPTGRQIVADAMREGSLGWIRDSVAAAGDSLMAGPVRRTSTGLALHGWFSAGRDGGMKLVWVSAASGRAGHGARTVPGALAAVAGGPAEGAEPAGGDGMDGLLAELRTWVGRADAALERGDLTAFGRAWEMLRRLLEP